MDEPKKAIIHFAGDEYFIGITPSGKALAVDTKSGRNSAPTPVELLMLAVAGCTAADVISILKKKRQDVREYRVEISGERASEHPRKFLKFFIKHIVTGREISEKAVADAIELSETKYCSVAATVRPTASIETGFEIIEVADEH
jgi:putative redox protein